MRIIIVEDEARVRERIKNILKKINTNYEVVASAENGETGLRLILDLQPDLIITDIRMSRMDGFEMLTELREHQCTSEVIVLSAHPEFAYAQQAVRLGVQEYILKPLDLKDFTHSLQNVDTIIQKRKTEESLLDQALCSILGSILQQTSQLDPLAQQEFELRLQIQPGAPIQEAVFFLGKNYAEEVQQTVDCLRTMFAERNNERTFFVILPEQQMIAALALDSPDETSFRKWLEKRIEVQRSMGSLRNISCGLVTAASLSQLHNALSQIYPYLDWNITQPEMTVICYPEVAAIQTRSCPSPYNFIRRMKISLWALDGKKSEIVFRQFTRLFTSGVLYQPRDIKECYLLFWGSVINTIHEIGPFRDGLYSQQEFTDEINEAKTLEELNRTAENILNLIKTKPAETNEETSLLIKQTLSIFSERFASGLTLNQLAVALHVTPEYLGTRFHKEMGVTFSTYSKNFRIEKAKQLLISTQAKMNEIAITVGYNDPKYFSRVFKESTGQLPQEYRKT